MQNLKTMHFCQEYLIDSLSAEDVHKFCEIELAIFNNEYCFYVHSNIIKLYNKLLTYSRLSLIIILNIE